ncbi:PREDICTED: von Willebrand factor A domain-containing protein 5B1 [Thamnophis sirtalis]|uniref:von Willebrand factor A domain-containing protein 5B1 n=1 Tax=Thamnophis sirtalis TaxID=35019 RepID=A0A6I9XVC4_9SAUR|nr:PREDICTED: von Willebrand factor A domain-containing protein 5B1 [Thamnophis sirtalis]
MPGLVNRTTSTVLPLAASEVTSCVSGYAFGMTACLSYRNSEDHPFEGMFIYPLDEYTTVVGFEAVIAERVVTVQIKDKARIEESGFSDGGPPDEEGHVVLDEDLERVIFVASVGIVPPQVDVSICISTSSELQTLPTGAVRVLLPAVCTPRVPQKASHLTSSLSGHHLPFRERHSSGGTLSPEQAGKFCLAHHLEAETTNPAEYDFSFSLEIRGPCLLAGVESPTHEIRADADPSARSARSITITLANKHTFDRPVEVLIHPSEPHMPHVLMEEGDMAPAQYEQHLSGRSDFIRGTKKDPSPEKKTEIIRKRLHKDIPHHPVIMLNFCPDLKTVQPNLRITHGEFIFLVDRSRSMAGTNIARVKMIRSLKAAMAPVVSDVSVDWVFPETTEVLISPVNASCLFPGDRLVAYSIVCDTSLYVSNPRLDKRRRYRMLHSQESGGSVFFHSQEEGGGGGGGGGGPENWEITKDPESGFPSERSSGEMGSESDVDSGIGPATPSQRRAYSSSQVAHREPPQKLPTASDSSSIQGSNPLRKVPLQELSRITSDAQPGQVEIQENLAGACESVRKIRADMGSTNVLPPLKWVIRQPIHRGHPRLLFLLTDGAGANTGKALELLRSHASSTRCYTFGLGKNACRRLLKGLAAVTKGSAEFLAEGERVQPKPLTAGPTPAPKKARGGAGPRRPSLLQDLCQLPRGPRRTGAGAGSGSQDPSPLSYLDSRSPGEPESAQHPSFNFETESTSDWDLPDLEAGSSAGGGWRGSRRSPCVALVKGLQNGQPVKWEITFDLGPLFQSRGDKSLAEREFEIEHGSGRRYQANAVHTSKSCNVISKFTAFVPVDLSSNNYLPSLLKYPNTGLLMKPSSQRSSEAEGRRWHRGLSASWGRIHGGGGPGLPHPDAEENIPSPPASLPSAGGNRQSFPDGLLRSPPASSQKSIENFFGARLTFNKARLLTKAARGFMGKFPAKGNELSSENENENVDYLPLVSLQLASGPFLLNKAFSEAIRIPLEKLRWSSPFACHRLGLSPSSSSRNAEAPGEAKSVAEGEGEAALRGRPPAAETSSRVPGAEGRLSPPSITIQSCSSPENAPSPPDSGRGSETETSELQAWLADVELQQRAEPEGMLWATAVALAWLEHSSASYFIEWELVAAKASRWLGEQDIPEGRNLPALKTAAQQLFVLLRHWNENLQFNLLCYNPKDV